MKQQVLAAAVAGGLVVGAGFVAPAISSPEAALAIEVQTEDESVRPFHNRGALLEEVLADLVEAGTIEQSQADEILSAFSEKAQELKEDRRANRQLIRGFLEDGVISADELTQLPDDHPFNDADGPFADDLEDGELTSDELRDSRPHPRRDAYRHGARLGALFDDGGIDAEEYEALPDDHPLSQIDVSEYLEDGVISIDELREIRRSLANPGDAA